MSETTHDAGSSETAFRLIYRSHSLIASGDRRSELGEIFTIARRKNRRVGVTGALIVSGDSFVQALEGKEAAVREIYAAITRDARHDGLSVLEERAVQGRTFGRWAMAKVATDGGPDIRLMSSASKGVVAVTPVTDASVTSEQETVLAFMRESIALDRA